MEERLIDERLQKLIEKYPSYSIEEIRSLPEYKSLLLTKALEIQNEEKISLNGGMVAATNTSWLINEAFIQLEGYKKIIVEP